MKKALLVCSLVATVILGCVKGEFDFKKMGKSTWEPTLAAPLIDVKLQISDVLSKVDKSGIIQVGSDNFATIVYSNQIFSNYAIDYLNIPDQVFGFGSDVPGADTIPFIPSAQQITFDSIATVNFNVGGSGSADSAVLSNGVFVLNISHNFQHDVDLALSIPALFKNSVAWTENISLPFNGGASYAGTFNLSGYHFDLSKGGTSSGEFDVEYSITLTGSGNGVSSSDQITVDGGFENLAYQVVYGDVGQIFLSQDVDSVYIGMFQDAIRDFGTVELADPNVKFTFHNSYGIPLDVGFSILEGYTPGSSPISLANSVPNPLPIYTPTVAQMGQSLDGWFELNAANSNLADLINSMPNSLVYQLSALTNATPGVVNYVMDSSNLSLDVELEIPLFGTATGFIIQDTMPFLFQNAHLFQSADLRIEISNGFPLDVDVQIYFADEQFQILDSLVKDDEKLLVSGQVVNGRVTEPSLELRDFHMSDDGFEHLKDSRFVILYTEISTSQNGTQNVKIYTDYALGIRMGGLALMDIKF